MKNQLISVITTIFSIIFLPITCLSAEVSPPKNIPASANTQSVKADKAYFRVLRTDSGKIEKIPVNDYLCGVLAAEMPASFEKEALKAQAVAAYTFALYKAESTTKDYDLTDDHKADQEYIPLSEAQKKWGENAAEYTSIIKGTVASVKGMYLSYNGKTALTVYHAISNGKTANCNEVWAKEVPYLVSVDSSFDKTAPSFISTVTLTKAELEEKLKDLAKLEGEPENYFKELKKSESGRISTLKICEKEVMGTELQSALSLRSASFDINYDNESFTFTVYGYGHGVGMSQNGANAMAKQGSDFREILYHYYPGTKIKT